ncbi:sensor domain-containing diguanylate cyclase [Pseudomonas sp. Marseille-QA0332]
MPHAKQGLRLDLRTLILVLSALTALVMLFTSYFASYRVQRQLLIDHALESNRVYAAKLASISEAFIGSAMKQLAVSATVQARQLDDPGALLEETDRLLQQSSAFNSTFVVDARGVMRAISPAAMHTTIGKQLQNPGAREALHERRPIVSAPYLSVANNLVVVLSHPIYDAQGNYQGYVGGSLYLREHNILNTLLGQHFYKDGSYLYVVDRNLRLLYHPDPQRVGTRVVGNPMLDDLAKQSSGTRRVTNSYGVDMLAGFAIVPSTGWGVVAQQPLEKTIAPLRSLILSVIGVSAPLVLLGSLILWWLALTIARPLWQLAAGAREMDEAQTREQIHGVRAWYFEAAELKRALLFGLNLLQERIGRLNRDAQTDPLTGLVNRRGLEQSLALLQAEARQFSVILLDIDHFKRVNDGHGHDVGDSVLRKLAELMRSGCREGDLSCRTGGEEFLMLLPGASLAVAAGVAERLRACVEGTPIEPVGAITLSLGVAHWSPEQQTQPAQTISEADRALYLAKQRGRNRVEQA